MKNKSITKAISGNGIIYIFPELLRTIHGHVCILKKRPDPEHEGLLRWSLPKKELCLCQGVVAPVMTKSCPPIEEEDAVEDMVL